MDKNTVCEPCSSLDKRTIANLFCMDCQEKLCSSCSESHTSYKAFRNHKIIDLKLTPLEGQTVELSYKCRKHSEMNIEFFCVYHDEVFCRDCLAKIHKKCQNTMSIESAAKDVKQSQMFSRHNISTKAISNTYEELASQMDKNIVDLNQDGNKIKEKIKTAKERIISQVLQEESNLNKELSTNVETSISKLQKSKAKVHDHQNKLEAFKTQLSFLADHGTEKQIFLYLKQTEENRKEFEDELIDMTSGHKTIVLDFKEETVDKASLSLGSLEMKEHSANITYTPPENIQAQIPTEVNIQTFELCGQIGAKGKVITGMTVTVDNMLLLCNRWGMEIMVYNDKNEYVQGIMLNINPWDITTIPGTNDAVVTSETDTLIFINTKTFKQTMVRKIKNAGCTYGIAATEDTLIIGDQKGKIHFTDVKGNHKRSITVTDSIIYYIHIGNNQNIFCTDINSAVCVKLDGSVVFKYSIPDEKEHRNIITDIQGYIYICGRNTNSVHRLYPDGALDRVILTRDHGLCQPISICFNAHCENIYISNFEDSILVFKCI